MIDIVKKISVDLVIPEAQLDMAIRLSAIKCRRIKIPKKSGGFRVAYQPAATLKPILAWLNSKVLTLLPVSQIAVAFRSKLSILHNANAHKDSLYSIRLDLSDFFLSIKSSDIRHAITRAANAVPTWATDEATVTLIERVCFDVNGRLPIGFLTSPAIANAIMLEIDNALLAEISKTARFGNAVLTRYADDFIFSTDKVGACNEFEKEFRELLAKTKRPSLEINKMKTRFMSRAGGSTLITGLRINNQGHPIVHSKYRDHVRLLIKHFAKGQLSPDDVPRLTGHLAYIEHVDPSFFTKLSFKYFAQIDKLRTSE